MRARLVKRRQALRERNLPRNSQLETHRTDEAGGGRPRPPRQLLLSHRTIDFPMPEKTHKGSWPRSGLLVWFASASTALELGRAASSRAPSAGAFGCRPVSRNTPDARPGPRPDRDILCGNTSSYFRVFINDSHAALSQGLAFRDMLMRMPWSLAAIACNRRWRIARRDRSDAPAPRYGLAAVASAMCKARKRQRRLPGCGPAPSRSRAAKTRPGSPPGRRTPARSRM